MLNPLGNPVPIVGASAIDCINGYVSKVLLQLASPMNVNGKYYIWTKKGYDSNTLLTACGFQIGEFDTLTIYVDSCPDLKIDLRNVTVINNDSIGLTWNLPTNAFPMVDWKVIFKQYNIYKSLLPSGFYSYLGSTYGINDTVFSDTIVDVQSAAYNYNVEVELTNTYASPPSDSIESIFLTCGQNALDTTKIDLEWTEYWGWANPTYEVYHASEKGIWIKMGSTTNTNYSFDKPVDANTYKTKVTTSYTLNSQTLMSESNWCDYNVPLYGVVYPNVFSPNGDGKNDFFEFKHLEQYHNTQLNIYNRWGKRVYQSDNYTNDWDGGKLSNGTYYYILQFTDGTIKTGTISLFK